MIRIRKKETALIPEILKTKGLVAINSLNDRYNKGERAFESKDFDSNIYGHDEVKKSLIEIQDYKCCFCESKIGHIAYVLNISGLKLVGCKKMKKLINQDIIG